MVDEKELTFFRGILSELMHEFPCGVYAVSLDAGDEDWSLHILSHEIHMEEWSLKESKLFKVLVKRSMPTIIPDALDASHLANDPLVSGDPKIRFYAEIPISESGGPIIGSLILADREPLHKLKWDSTDFDMRAQDLAVEMSALNAATVETAVASFASVASTTLEPEAK
eukprot:TRINITY_DN22640_c0_g1_i1.p1 TRINITY_DN22640_c0_g1~~TRINITY_DN22640_c0_g1_i1.p1  ORF type:complete len:196 (-),score=21.31 TRINITY_DN22640_c0_g1_i1:37-543(-)